MNCLVTILDQIELRRPIKTEARINNHIGLPNVTKHEQIVIKVKFIKQLKNNKIEVHCTLLKL